MTIKEKILNGIMLTEQEVRSIYYEDEEGINAVTTILYGRYGYKIKEFILKVGTRYFSILVYEGAYHTDYPEQIAEEVEPIVKIEWVKKQQGKNND